MLAKEPIEIPVENFSFELPGTEKIVGWNGDGTPAVDIPGWSSDTAAADSGVESDWPGHTEGLWSGFLMGMDPSIWNPLNYVIKPGDDIVLLVDARDNWTAAAALPAKLEMTIYRLVDGQRTPLVTNTVELTTAWATYSLEFKANAVPELIGSALGGIELKNVSNATPENNSWIGLDNVGLFDVSGEP